VPIREPRCNVPTAYISLGSNLGDRLGFLKEALQRLKRSKGISISKRSSVYETQPVGPQDQGWFLNLVIEMKTTLDPASLLDHLLAIEDQMGRKRDARWGPRSIDLDVLLYDDRIVNTNRLIIPHPRLHQRRFALVPLSEIAPQVRHPTLKKTIRELLDGCPDTHVVRSYPGKV
jgi:2-amino-4-hydroxy-6-hydroxymethyldihydropteridine diphosphokinase